MDQIMLTFSDSPFHSQSGAFSISFFHKKALFGKHPNKAIEGPEK